MRLHMCSVLQRIAAYCNVLQRVATCCSVLQCVAVCWGCVYVRVCVCEKIFTHGYVYDTSRDVSVNLGVYLWM